jgi:hypothetical protein
MDKAAQVELLCSGLQQQIDRIDEQQKRRGPKRYAEAAEDADDLIECYRRIDALFRQLQVSGYYCHHCDKTNSTPE